ncbi:unnamed protein product [Ceutorhynchus assimilis]|uniref:DNA topoisomerase (ATP-hydrolyzing) n=1 Tax=Ceutorhynchus assimilis TaxID=467358 RepID=A0A9N9QK08_9CUCU|nr:unnamed protein product [Ceutorhynchus assimilis]
MDDEYFYRINLLFRDNKSKVKLRILPDEDEATKRRRKARKKLKRMREVSTPKKIAHNIKANTLTNSNTPLLDKFFEAFPITAFQTGNQNIPGCPKKPTEMNLETIEKQTPQATISEKGELSMEVCVNITIDQKENLSETDYDQNNTVLEGLFKSDQINQTPKKYYEYFGSERLDKSIITGSNKSSSTISSSSPQFYYCEEPDRSDQLISKELECQKEIKYTPETQNKCHNFTNEAIVFKPATSTFNRNKENSGRSGKSLLSVDSVKRFQSSPEDITKMHFKKTTKCSPNIFSHRFRTISKPSLSQEKQSNFYEANRIKRRLIFDDKQVNVVSREFENNSAGKIVRFNESEKDRPHQDFFTKINYNSKQSFQQHPNVYMFETKNNTSFFERQQCNSQKVSQIKRNLLFQDKEVNKNYSFWEFENYKAGKNVPPNESYRDIPQQTSKFLAKETNINLLDHLVLNDKSYFNCKKNLQDQQPASATSATTFEKINAASHKVTDRFVKSKQSATCLSNPDGDNWPPKFEETAAFLRKLLQGKSERASLKLTASEIQSIDHCDAFNKEIDQTSQPNNSEIVARKMVNNAAASQMSQIISQTTLFSSEGYETMPSNDNISDKPSDNRETPIFFKENAVDYIEKNLENDNSKQGATENNGSASYVQNLKNIGVVEGDSNAAMKQRPCSQSQPTITNFSCDMQNTPNQPIHIVSCKQSAPEVSKVDTQNKNKPDMKTNFISTSCVEQHDNEPTTFRDNATKNNREIDIINVPPESIINHENMQITEDLINDTLFTENIIDTLFTSNDYDENLLFNKPDKWFNFSNKPTVESNNIFSSQPNMFQEDPFMISQENRKCCSQMDNEIAQKECKLRESNALANCIIHKDNLLKELLTQKNDILKSLHKNRRKIQISDEQEVLAKTYIKKYTKDNMRIFKIKQQFKSKFNEQYQPPEEQIMNRFTEKANKDFRDDESLTYVEELERVSSPNSYMTDDTNLNVLPTSNESENLSQTQLLLREAIDELYKDPTLQFSRYSESAPKELDRTSILVQIQTIIIGILEDYENNDTPYFEFPMSIDYIFKDERYQIKESARLRRICFKINNMVGPTRFNVMLFVLNKIRILLETDTKLTKREIYYQVRTILKKPYLVDTIICNISRILKVGPWALNITAQKGLVYGNLKLVMDDAEIVNCNVPGTCVPKDVTSICEIHTDAHFILVVEKDSIFQKLIDEDLPKRLTRPFILITGKGYPDLSTQLFLKKLWMTLSVPVFILVDADPDGISIMFNYRFGSLTNAHISEHLAIPKARWIGVFPTDIRKFEFPEQCLSKREIEKLQSMLRMECVRKNQKIKEQLEYQLDHGIKTGIEGVQKNETYLSNQYLTTKFYSKDFI